MSCEEVFLKLSSCEDPVKGKPTQVNCLKAFVIDHLHEAPRNGRRHVSPQAPEPTGQPDMFLDWVPANYWTPIIVVDIVINRLASFQGRMFEALKPGLKQG